jgi:hypothetical protein
VDARVREILGLRVGDALVERASVTREGTSLHVTLRGADTHVHGDRLLPADGSCDEQATMVAVLLATWISDVHPEYVGTRPEPAVTSVLAAPAVESAAQPELPARAPPAITPSAPVRDSASAAVSRQPGAPQRRLELSAAAGGALSSADPAPVAALGARYLPESGGFGAALQLTFTLPRRALLSSGAVRYFRWPIAVGPALRTSIGSSRLDVTAGPAAAWLHLGGVGFQGGTSSHDAVAFGGAAAARWALPQGSVAPFVELCGMAFAPTQAYVRRGNEQPSVDLPSFELYAALGGAFRAF